MWHGRVRRRRGCILGGSGAQRPPPFENNFLARTATLIINEARRINRVVDDITSKPPGTIEWEYFRGKRWRLFCTIEFSMVSNRKRLSGLLDPANMAGLQAPIDDATVDCSLGQSGRSAWTSRIL